MRIGDCRRVERLEERHRAARARAGAAAPLTDEEIDERFRALLMELRDAEGSAASVAFYDAVLDLSGLTFSRCVYFLFLLLHAIDTGDGAEIDRAAHRLDGRLREEAPLAWAAGYPEGWPTRGPHGEGWGR